MGKFNRNNKRSSGGFGRGSSARGRSAFGGGGGNRFGGRSALHKATCSECGNSCDLPFKPTGGRPVYCNDCFKKQSGGGRQDKFSGDRRERPCFDDRQKYDAVCTKCGNDCQVPFRPTASKPVFCNNCFDRGGNRSGGNKDSSEITEQIRQLNVKIDKLIKMLTPNGLTEKAGKPIATKEEETAKEVVKEKKEKSKTKTKKKK